MKYMELFCLRIDSIVSLWRVVMKFLPLCYTDNVAAELADAES